MSLARALVTGGSGAIGSAVCRHLARQNRHVIVHGNRRVAQALQVAEAIKAQGGSAEAVSFDVTDGDQTAQILTELAAREPIQIIVNNAGIHQDAPMAGMSRKTWTETIDVSLHGFYNVTRPLLLPMIRTRWGRIVNMSSVAAAAGNRGQVNYAAAKAALHGATRALALELASRRITVNAVAPGIIDSDMSEDSFDPELIQKLVPMRRAGTCDEVAALVAFLCSDQAAYISGQIIGINGAMA